MACTGLEYCKLALVTTKQRAIDLVDELERRFPDLDTPITVNVNGCPNACARTQVADIGLKGQLVLGEDGEQVEGFQVHLGGGIGLTTEHDTPFGRKLRAHKVTSAQLGDYVTAVVICLPRRPGRRRDLRPVGRARRRGRPAWRRRAGGGRMTAATTSRRSATGAAAPTGMAPDELRELVRHAGAELELAPAEDILEWAVATFGERFCVTSSMADAVLAHLAAQVAPGVDVVFVDTGYHFAETIGTRDAVAAVMPVTVRTVSPRSPSPSRHAAHGPDLFRRDPDLCCALRKVEPLERALTAYDAWATGLRRNETRDRVVSPVIGWDERRGKVKVSPLARWTDDAGAGLRGRARRAGQPAAVRRLPLDRLRPVHAPGRTGEDTRSGRWPGLVKSECGLHT